MDSTPRQKTLRCRLPHCCPTFRTQFDPSWSLVTVDPFNLLSKTELTERFGLNGSSVRTNWERRLFCLRVNSSVKHANLPAEYHSLTDIQLTSTRSGGETSVAPKDGLALSDQDRCLACDHALIQCFIIPRRRKPRWVDKASEITFCIFILSRPG